MRDLTVEHIKAVVAGFILLLLTFAAVIKSSYYEDVSQSHYYNAVLIEEVEQDGRGQTNKF